MRAFCLFFMLGSFCILFYFILFKPFLLYWLDSNLKVVKALMSCACATPSVPQLWHNLINYLAYHLIRSIKFYLIGSSNDTTQVKGIHFFFLLSVVVVVLQECDASCLQCDFRQLCPGNLLSFPLLDNVVTSISGQKLCNCLVLYVRVSGNCAWMFALPQRKMLKVWKFMRDWRNPF